MILFYIISYFRPMQLVSTDSSRLTPAQKVSELLAAMDDDGDDAADPWELHEWMVHVQNIVYK